MQTDGLGSVRAITDSGGNLLQTFQTDEFGNQAMTQGTNTEPFRYTGQQVDPETGLYDLRARYHMPWIGHFISADLVRGNHEGPRARNQWTQSLNEPITLTDLGGIRESIWGEIGGLPLLWLVDGGVVVPGFGIGIGTVVSVTIVESYVKDSSKLQPNWVVRGGYATPDRLQNGSKDHLGAPGVYGFSVQVERL